MTACSHVGGLTSLVKMRGQNKSSILGRIINQVFTAPQLSMSAVQRKCGPDRGTRVCIAYFIANTDTLNVMVGIERCP